MFILQLISNNTYAWFEIAPNGDIISHREFSALSDCPPINPAEKVTVLIPGEQVTIASVPLPKMRASERVPAITFALEERLASDPEEAVIALGDYHADGITTVAVIDKGYFEKVILSFQEIHLSPRCVLPDFLAISWVPETWSILFCNQMALIRTDLQHGFSLDANNLFLFLQMWLEKNPDKKPTKIIFLEKNNAIDSLQLEKLAIPFEINENSQKHYFDKALFTKPALNLLQGKYRPKTHISVLQRNWIIGGATTAAFILFLLLSNIIELFYFQHQLTDLQLHVTKAYQKIFPGEPIAQDPRARVATLLKQLEDASLRTVFIRLLNNAGSTLSRFPDITTQSITFADKKLHFTVQVTNVQLLTQWADALHAQHLVVTQHVLKTEQNNVQAEMIVGSAT